MASNESKEDGFDKVYGGIGRKYNQKSVKERIKALFLDNLGKVITREQILGVSKDPVSHKEPENWHQRLSELRTDDGYTILSWSDNQNLKVEEYLMPNASRREIASPQDKTIRKYVE